MKGTAIKSFLVLRSIFIALLWVGVLICGWSQELKQVRFEKEQRDRDEYFSIIPLKESGLALVRKGNDFENGKQQWELIVLDTALNISHSLTLYVDARYPMIGYEYVGGSSFYLLFREGEHNRTGMELVEINLLAGHEVGRYSIKPEVDFKITQFIQAGENMVFGGYIATEPAILVFEKQSRQIRVLPGLFKKNNEIIDLRTNVNNTFNVVVFDGSNRDLRKIVFKTFSEDGTELLDDAVSISDDRSFMKTISSTLVRDDLMLLGTWGPRQSKQAAGFYSLTIDPFNEQKIKFITFGQLNNFLNYLNEKRATKIKEKTKNDIAGNETPSFTAHVMPYRIEETSNGYIMLAEVYNPAQTSNPYYNSPYGNPYYSPYGYSPFWGPSYPGMRMYRPYNPAARNAEEVRSLSAAIIMFDGGGNVRWDYSIKFDEKKKPSLEQVSDFSFQSPFATILFKNESEIKGQHINIFDGTVQEIAEPIQLRDSFDVVRNENEVEEGIKHWYGSTFYCWGYQTIRNASHENRVREVFYINKVTPR